MPIVELRYKVLGTELPVDHAYKLFSGLSVLLPDLHGMEGVAIGGVTGRMAGGRRLHLNPGSFLPIRCAADRIPALLKLAGRKVTVGEDTIRLGIPEARALDPHPCVYSRLVAIRGFMEPGPFLEAVNRQLADLGVTGMAALPSRRNSESPVALRRTLRIRDREIVGFAVRIRDLSPEHSLRLQEMGVGGRRHFGCGFFIPDKR